MWLFFGLPVLVIFLMMVIHASSSLDKVKENWSAYRCNPAYMPFAGWIRPDIGTSENFYHCMNSMGSSIFSYFMDAIHGVLKEVMSGTSEVTGSLLSFRGLFSGIRKFMLSFATTTFGKIANSTSTFSYILIKIRDILKRFVGEGYIAAFLVNTGIDFILSFVYLLITIIKVFVYALLAVSIILALFQPELLVFAVVIASALAASGF